MWKRVEIRRELSRARTIAAGLRAGLSYFLEKCRRGALSLPGPAAAVPSGCVPPFASPPLRPPSMMNSPTPFINRFEVFAFTVLLTMMLFGIYFAHTNLPYFN